jgi:hypothetical protein
MFKCGSSACGEIDIASSSSRKKRAIHQFTPTSTTADLQLVVDDLVKEFQGRGLDCNIKQQADHANAHYREAVQRKLNGDRFHSLKCAIGKRGGFATLGEGDKTEH